MNIDFIITTGHLTGGKLNESAWMRERPDLMENAYAAVAIEHLGAIEFRIRRPFLVQSMVLRAIWSQCGLLRMFGMRKHFLYWRHQC
ncbi:hypothetical protein F5Y16DRAFT_368620 [Xylariaceae sp. FL0255]|nr:hypothetical protein F5Y16DRAFT_368620 [Xylariaceae sp. FL0255]